MCSADRGKGLRPGWPHGLPHGLHRNLAEGQQHSRYVANENNLPYVAQW